MNVDITKRQIDMEKLDSAITTFKDKNKTCNVYLFMNIDTASALTLNHDFEEQFKSHTFSYSKSIFEYCGCKVYFNENLKYGEVEIR